MTDKNRLGSILTFLGAMVLLVVASGFPENTPAAFLGFVLILGGVVMRC